MPFHVNDQGVAGPCDAKIECPFGDLKEDHYGSKAEARKAYELKQDSVPPALSKTYSWPDEPENRKFKSARGEISFQVTGPADSWHMERTAQGWLTIPGEGNVAFISLIIEEDSDKPYLSLCDIETRPDSRKRGYAKELIESIEKETGWLTYSSGSYTPEGWEALGEKMRTYDSDYDKPGVKFDSMGFVASWKHMVPRNMDRGMKYTDEQRDAAYELSDAGVFRKMDDKEILWVEE